MQYIIKYILQLMLIYLIYFVSDIDAVHHKYIITYVNILDILLLMILLTQCIITNILQQMLI